MGSFANGLTERPCPTWASGVKLKLNVLESNKMKQSFWNALRTNHLAVLQAIVIVENDE